MTVGSEFKNCHSAWVSLSCYATVQLTAFRNKEDADGKPQEMGCLETVARRFTAEIGYALLAIVSVIETLVRLAFSLIVIPVFCALGCCVKFSNETAECIANLGISGVLLSAENVANAAVALFTNLCQSEINYDQLIPCIAGSNGPIDVSVFTSDEE